MSVDEAQAGSEAVLPADLAHRGSWEKDLEGIHVLFGAGSLNELGRQASELGGRRILLVADPGITACGYSSTALDSLSAAGLEPRLFDAVQENPTDEDASAGARAADEHRADLLVGLGGGSPMDCAKAVNFLMSGGGEISRYEGYGRAGCEMLPSIGVPTTAGTGSEAQSYALITEAATHRKMPCGDLGVRFRTVILDPALTGSQPARTAAASSLDAVSHAIESFVTRRRTAASAALSLAAWRLLDSALPRALQHAEDREVWGAMQIGAFLAGAAIERSMLGAAHSLANPLTATYGTTHGVAVSLMLPNVVRFNASEVTGLYAQLVPGDGDAAERLAVKFETLRAAAGLPGTLRDSGVPAADRHRLVELAQSAARQWTLQFNPRPASVEDLLGLYERTF